MKVKVLLVIGLIVAVGAVLTSGCCFPASCSDQISKQVGDQVKKGVEKGIKNSTGTTVNTNKTKEVTGEDLTSVPRYQGSTRTLYIKGAPVNGNISVSLTYETTDDAAKVVSWYKEKMAGLGWTISLTVAGQDGGEMNTYQKNDNAITATVNVTRSNNKTDIVIMYNGPEAGA